MSLEERAAWGDVLVAEDTLPPKEEYGPDENGIRTVIEYKWGDEDASGNRTKEKIITKMQRVTKETRTSKGAEERQRNWQRFGMAAESNDGVTTHSFDPVRIEKPGEEADDAMANKLESTLKNAFWRRAQRQQHASLLEQAGIDTSEADDMNAADIAAMAASSGKYVPPSKLKALQANATGGLTMEDALEEESTTLKISNLTPEATEDDLRDMCRQFGGLQRVHIAKSHDTGESRGFAFVTFHLRADAERAKKTLNGFGYDHLILKVDWAQQRKRDPGAEGGLSGGFVSGYGKALPQMPGKAK